MYFTNIFFIFFILIMFKFIIRNKNSDLIFFENHNRYWYKTKYAFCDDFDEYFIRIKNNHEIT